MKRSALVVFSFVALACEPLGPVPGGALSGSVAEPVPADWSFTDAHDTIQLETRPGDPYSVNLWGVSIAGDFYLASGGGGSARWVEHIADDPNVRLRVGDAIYELRAVRVGETEERALFLDAIRRKYDWEPSADDTGDAWLFRLEARDPGPEATHPQPAG